MPHRTLTVAGGLLGLLGLGVLLVLLIVRTDPQRAAAKGPRWKRGLVTAGLALLAAAGFAVLVEPEIITGPGCYQPAQPGWVAGQAGQDLEGRLAALEKMAAEGKLTPEVAQRVLASMEHQAGPQNEAILEKIRSLWAKLAASRPGKQMPPAK